jgi:hypothetical protein
LSQTGDNILSFNTDTSWWICCSHSHWTNLIFSWNVKNSLPPRLNKSIEKPISFISCKSLNMSITWSISNHIAVTITCRIDSFVSTTITSDWKPSRLIYICPTIKLISICFQNTSLKKWLRRRPCTTILWSGIKKFSWSIIRWASILISWF